jgi:hypothetical protein
MACRIGSVIATPTEKLVCMPCSTLAEQLGPVGRRGRPFRLL